MDIPAIEENSVVSENGFGSVIPVYYHYWKVLMS